MAASLQDPSITDWMQAWGTLVGAFLAGFALIVAVYTVRNEARKSRAERERMEEDRADMLAAHARLVYSDLVFEKPGGDETAVFKCVVRNNGMHRIIVMGLYVGYPTATRVELPQNPTVVEAGETVAIPTPNDFVPRVAFQDVTYLVFLDAAGLYWFRVARGTPRRIVSRDDPVLIDLLLDVSPLDFDMPDPHLDTLREALVQGLLNSRQERKDRPYDDDDDGL